MKQILSIVCLLSLVGVALGMGAVAQTSTSTVTTTVNIGTVSVTVDEGTVTYGTMPYDTEKTSLSVLLNNIKATVGSVITDLTIKGSDTEDWTLSTNTGENLYIHSFGLAVDSTTEAGDYSPLSTTPTVFVNDMTASSTQYFGLKIKTAASGKATTQTSVVTLTAIFGN